MDSALSEEEFHRLQLQLIELRTENYQLSDKCKKQDNELVNLNQQLESVNKEYQKASKAINKSKKAKEFELLIQENDNLQRRLHSQEDEFRLQNGTIMQELSTLVVKNEELEAAVAEYEKQGTGETTQPAPSQQSQEDTSKVDKELMRLQAENSALQTNIGEIRSKFENELKLLRSAVEGVDITDSSTGASDQPDLTNLIQDSKLLSELNDLKLALSTEKESNKLLHEKITSLEKASSAEAADQLREKLKKKQESYVALQTEKESLYADSNQKITSLEEARQRDSKNFRAQIEKLNEELRVAREEAAKTQQQCDQRVNDFEITIKTLKLKVDENSAKNLEVAQQELFKLRSDLETSEQTISTLRAELEQANNELIARDTLLAEREMAISQLQSTLSETETALAEKSQAAEKRKKLLDELAIKSQEDSDCYKTKLTQLELSRKQEVEGLKSNHKSELSELSQKLESERSKSSQLDKYKADLESLNDQYRSLDETKGWLQRSLQETEERLKEMEEAHEQEKNEATESHDHTLSEMSTLHEQSIVELEEQVTEKSDLLEKANSEISTLQQKVSDNKQDMKLHEKKGASLMKDLKRQLAQERKRADRLEQKLQEVTSPESKQRQQSSEPFFLPIDAERSSIRADDASSVSSWSGANFSHISNSSAARDISVASLNRESTPRSSPQNHNSEHDVPSLLILVESLQREKTSLTERVSILEQSSSAMADDLVNKQSIIEHYSMEGKEYVNHAPKRQEKMTLKRVMDFVKDKGDEGLNERYRKSQNMLEETLTKNIALQNNLEILSKQLADAEAKIESAER